jgi:hypothetical protein
MTRMFKMGVAATALLAGTAVSGNSFAQEAGAEGEVGMGLPGGAPGARAGAAQGDSDHDAMIGRIGVGYLGARQVPTASGGPAGPALAFADAPVVGLRYWIDQMLGLDIGLGFLNTSGSTTTQVGATTTTTDDPSFLGLIVHAGVPLSLASSKHYSFQIVPEANIGFSTATQETPNVGETTFQGFGVELGARAGAEVHFGFIGIPELALQGGIGLFFRTATATVTDKPNQGQETEGKRSDSQIGTTVNGQPWDIFTSNIAAMYYF